MTQQEVVCLIADALRIDPDQLTPDTVANDIEEWDSIGSLAILAEMDRLGIALAAGAAKGLQSTAGVLDAFRRAGMVD